MLFQASQEGWYKVANQQKNNTDEKWKEEIEKKQASVEETDSKPIEKDIEVDEHVKGDHSETKKRTGL